MQVKPHNKLVRTHDRIFCFLFKASLSKFQRYKHKLNCQFFIKFLGSNLLCLMIGSSIPDPPDIDETM